MSLSTLQLAQRFFAFMEGRNAPGTVYYYRLHVTRWIAAVGDLPVSEVKRHHLLEWGKSWHAIQAVQRLFAWAHTEMELIDRNPFRGVKKPAIVGRARCLTRAELAKLYRGADRRFRAVLLALRESIARPQEIRALTWESIRWDGGHGRLLDALAAESAYFELIEYKSRKQRVNPNTTRKIPINARLSRYLLRLLCADSARVGYLFTDRRGRPWTSNAIRLRMRRLCQRVGIVADQRGERVVAYTLRHTSATEACANGMPDRVLAELMGHTSTRTTSRYQHPTMEHVRDALKRTRRKRNDSRN